jgi:hypothetical protein
LSVIAAIGENNRPASRQPRSRPPPERYHRQVQDAGQRLSTPRSMNAYQWAVGGVQDLVEK